MQEIHRQGVRLRSLGLSNTEIARELQVSKNTVDSWVGSELFQREVEILSGAMDADTIDIGKRIREFAPKALDYLEKIVLGQQDGERASVALKTKVADKFLDRAGYVAPKVIQGQHLHGHFTAEDIEDIKRRAKKYMPKRIEQIVEQEALE